MTRLRLVVVFLVCVALCGAYAAPQTHEELRSDQATSAVPASDNLHRLTKELSLARKAGDITRVRELERDICQTLPSLPPDAAPPVYQDNRDDTFDAAAGPLWGDDVKVYTGPMYSHGRRQLALDVDTLGGIFLAINSRYQDTLSILRAYRSTTGGRTWSYVGGFMSAGRAIQSFDMCVTDSSAGTWLLGFVFITKSDLSSNGGGHLYWGSMLSNGSNWRYTLIDAADASTNYRNPSICTDGTLFTPSMTYHYIATEYITPSTDLSRGLLITRTTNWGKNWLTPDTTVRGFQEATPTIAIDWSTSPDSLVVAFTRFAAPSRSIRVARNSFTFPASWTISYPSTPKDDFDPSLAIDPVRGNAMITYTRATGAPTYNDAMYLYSTDLFRTFTRDSIATSTDNEELTSVAYAPWAAGYYWRTAYRSSEGSDVIYYKAVMDKLSGLYSATPRAVSQFRPTGTVIPVVGHDRDLGGTSYRGNVAYVGYGPQDVYFDAVDLALDVPDAEVVPGTYALNQNYPNPFNPSTTIAFHLGQSGPVKLSVYDLLGREVVTLLDGQKDAGPHTLTFDASTRASGVYLYRLQAAGFMQTRTMVLMK